MMISWRLFLGVGFSFLLFLAVEALQKQSHLKGKRTQPEHSHSYSHLISEAYFIKLKPYFTFSPTSPQRPSPQEKFITPLVRFNGESIALSTENKRSLSEGKETLIGPVRNIYSGLNEIFIEIPQNLSSPLPLLFLTLEILKEGQSLLKTSFWNSKKESFIHTTHIYL